MPCLRRAAPLTDPIQILQLWQSIKILGDDLKPHTNKRPSTKTATRTTKKHNSRFAVLLILINQAHMSSSLLWI